MWKFICLSLAFFSVEAKVEAHSCPEGWTLIGRYFYLNPNGAGGLFLSHFKLSVNKYFFCFITVILGDLKVVS